MCGNINTAREIFSNQAHFRLTTPSLLCPDDGLSTSYPTLPAYRTEVREGITGAD